VNVKHLVLERGDAVKRYIGFCGGPAPRPGRGHWGNGLCSWQSGPLPSGEQAERAVIEHYRVSHPKEFAKVSDGKLVGAPLVSRIDLEDDDAQTPLDPGASPDRLPIAGTSYGDDFKVSDHG
jgi:hypothetical protein